MSPSPPDPYATLGVSASATDAEVRAAYRQAVQRHHPDHNNGSPESARRFEEVQEAYARIRALRQGGGAAAGGRTGAGGAATAGRTGAGGAAAGRAQARTHRPGTHRPGTQGPGTARPGAQRPQPPPAAADPAVEARLAQLERELREAQRAREQAEREAREARKRARRAAQAANAAADAAREAARQADDPEDRRPSDEELGYIRTDDSFSKIIADARDQLGGRLQDAREGPVGQRISDLIDELEDLTSRLTGDSPKRPRR